MASFIPFLQSSVISLHWRLSVNFLGVGTGSTQIIVLLEMRKLPYLNDLPLSSPSRFRHKGISQVYSCLIWFKLLTPEIFTADQFSCTPSPQRTRAANIQYWCSFWWFICSPKFLQKRFLWSWPLRGRSYCPRHEIHLWTTQLWSTNSCSESLKIHMMALSYFPKLLATAKYFSFIIEVWEKHN